MSRTKTTGGLLAALAAAGEEELREVRQRIDGLRTELAALSEVEKILERRLHGPKPRKAPGGGDTLRSRIRECILANGPGTVQALASKLGVEPQAVRMSLQRSKADFTCDDDGRFQVRL